MNIKNNIFSVCLLLFSLFIFYIYDGVFVNAKSYQQGSVQNFIQNESDNFDYLFTVKEVSLSKITDDSITITSENIDKDFLKNARSLKNNEGYGVKYEDDELTISGLIPDFLYNSIYVEAKSYKNEKYILKIANFKTAKSQNLIKQFVTQTLQYTLKRSITPIEFYTWEHKILTKQVTPEEFIFNVLNSPRILYNLDDRENIIGRIYSSLFLESIDENEFKVWSDKFDQYKEKYFVRDGEAYNFIIEEMLKTENFKNRIDMLNTNIKNLKIPTKTIYSEIYKDFKGNYNKIYNKIRNLYIMDYDELNRTEVTENSAELFLNESFDGVINNFTKASVNIPNAKVVCKNGKIIIEGLESNTIYKNFKVTYINNGKENKIFVKRIKTKNDEGQESLNKNVVNMEFNILDELGINIDEFLKYFYGDEYDSKINEIGLEYLRILFTIDNTKFEKFLSLINKSDFGVESDILISKLYNFIFNRIPDEEGLKFWLEKFEVYKGFMSNLHEISNKIALEMTCSQEFKDRFSYVILEKIIKFNNGQGRLQFS